MNNYVVFKWQESFNKEKEIKDEKRKNNRKNTKTE